MPLAAAQVLPPYLDGRSGIAQSPCGPSPGQSPLAVVAKGPSLVRYTPALGRAAITGGLGRAASTPRASQRAAQPQTLAAQQQEAPAEVCTLPAAAARLAGIPAGVDFAPQGEAPTAQSATDAAEEQEQEDLATAVAPAADGPGSQLTAEDMAVPAHAGGGQEIDAADGQNILEAAAQLHGELMALYEMHQCELPKLCRALFTSAAVMCCSPSRLCPAGLRMLLAALCSHMSTPTHALFPWLQLTWRQVTWPLSSLRQQPPHFLTLKPSSRQRRQLILREVSPGLCKG